MNDQRIEIHSWFRDDTCWVLITNFGDHYLRIDDLRFSFWQEGPWMKDWKLVEYFEEILKESKATEDLLILVNSRLTSK